MILRYCFYCRFHSIKEMDGQRWSHCSKENLWSKYTKCVMQTALESFLQRENSGGKRTFSALDHVYSDKD